MSSTLGFQDEIDDDTLTLNTNDERKQRKLELDRQLRQLDNESTNLDTCCAVDGSDSMGGPGSKGSVGHADSQIHYRPPLQPQLSSSSMGYYQQAAALTNGPLNSYPNPNGTANSTFPPRRSSYDPRYLATASANTFHHVNMPPSASNQHELTRQDNQNDPLIWKVLQDRENELKEVRKTLQQTQSQFQEQLLLATKLQTTLDQKDAAFEQERLIIKLQVEKEAQVSLALQQQEFFQKQLQWMEQNIDGTRNAHNYIQQKDVSSIDSVQHSDQTSVQSTAASIGKSSTAKDGLNNDTNDRVEHVEESISISKANNVNEKKYPWTGTKTSSPAWAKISTVQTVDKRKNDRTIIKKLYPSINETLMHTDELQLENSASQSLLSNPANLEQQDDEPKFALDSKRISGDPEQIITLTETPTTTNNENSRIALTNDSSGRFEPIYVTHDTIEEDTDFVPPADDDRSLEQTVASSTYGDDRAKVVNKTILDPYGDKGTFTGIILRNTGMPHGQGKMLYEEDQRVFEGDWRHGRWHGYGRATFSNGDSYEGQYKFDQRHGTGVYRWNDGRVYDGQFSEDKRHGKGKFIWPDGAVYKGDFMNGQREGEGIYVFADGGEYEGMWKDGKYDGKGTCTWQDGRCYHGEWRTGMAHGKGRETYPNGKVRHEGDWIDDEPVRGDRKSVV